MYTYLKFGLPRVFPPAVRDGSSGYDSSDDGGGGGGRRKDPGGWNRSKSNPDLLASRDFVAPLVKERRLKVYPYIGIA